MEDRAHISRFVFLKTILDGIFENPSKEHPKLLSKSLESLDDDTVETAFVAIFLPIQIKLHEAAREKVRNDSVEVLLDCLACLLRRGNINSIDTFFHVYICTVNILPEEDEQTSLSRWSEECKRAIIQCWIWLFRNTSHDTLIKFYQQNECYKKLSPLVFHCTQFAVEQIDRKIRLDALGCTLEALQLDSELSQFTSGTVREMLPGILSASGKLVPASGSVVSTTHHSLIVSALKLWGKAVSVALSDCCPSGAIPQLTVESITKRNLSPLDAWMEVACTKMGPVTRGIISGAISHPDRRVRKQLAVSVTSILLALPLRLLKGNVTPLIECLLTLKEDDEETVSEWARLALAKVLPSDKSETEMWSTRDSMVTGLSALLTRLPRMIRSADCREGATQVKLLCGYLRLPGLIRHIMSSGMLLERLISCLVDIALMDTALMAKDSSAASLTASTSSMLLLSGETPDSSEMTCKEVSIVDCLNDAATWRVKPLKLCTIGDVEGVCSAVRESCDESDKVTIAYRLMDALPASPCETVLLINRIVIPALSRNGGDGELIDGVFREYLSWLETLLSSSRDGMTPSEIRSNMLLVCLLAEGLGLMATTLGRDIFSPLIVRCIYLVLQTASSSQYFVSQYGLECLKAIGKSMGYNTIRDTIAAHSDYLCNAIQHRLIHYYGSSSSATCSAPSSLDILAMVVKHSQPANDPMVSDIVNRAVLNTIGRGRKDRQCQLTMSHLKVLEAFLLNLSPSNCEDSSIPPPEKGLKISLISRILDHQKAVHQSKVEQPEGEFDYEEVPSEENIQSYKKEAEQGASAMDVDEEPEIEEYVRISEAIVRSVANLIPSKDIGMQLLALRVVGLGCCGPLAKSEKILLPVVHTVWSPLVGRFGLSSDPLVISRAFTLLNQLASVSLSFMRRRITKDLLPRLRSLLEKCSNESDNKPTSYSFTQQFKMQITLLTGLGDLCHYIELDGRDAELLLDSTLPYLSSTQPNRLQESCLQLWKLLDNLEPDIVWIKLLSLKECGAAKYSENVTKLSQYIVDQ